MSMRYNITVCCCQLAQLCSGFVQRLRRAEVMNTSVNEWLGVYNGSDFTVLHVSYRFAMDERRAGVQRLEVAVRCVHLLREI